MTKGVDDLKTIKSAALLVFAAVTALAGYMYLRLKKSLPLTDGELELEGLTAPVEVTFDKAGSNILFV